MGHSTKSGRSSGGVTRQERELRDAVRSGDLDRANRIQNAIDRGTLATATERRAVENFLRDRADQLNSAQGAQIASNQFQFAGMSNEQAVDIMNAMGRDRYEIHEERTPGSFWTNGAPIIRHYIRKVGGDAERRRRNAQVMDDAVRMAQRREAENRRRGQEAARNMTSRRRR